MVVAGDKFIRRAFVQTQKWFYLHHLFHFLSMKKFILLAFTACSLVASAQEVRHNKKDGPFNFTVVKDISATDVENQYRSSTCWSFSSLSFLESELIRMGKGRMNLSEMFVVRNTYADKADKHVRMQGKVNFGPGGAFHDMTNCLRNHGAVPEEVYPTTYMDGTDKPKHGELDEKHQSIPGCAGKTAKR